MCIRCSGIHRNLGVHISFVRSVSLDEWKSTQVEMMVRWGNKRANSYWEATVPEDYYIPDENDPVQQMERWIRDKYEKGKFKAKSKPSCASTEVDLNVSIADVMVQASGTSKGEKKAAKAAAAAVAAGGGGAATATAAATSVAMPLATRTSSGGAGAAPLAPPVAALVKAKPVVVDDFDFLGFDAFPAPTTNNKPTAPAATAVVDDLNSAFGSFGVSSTSSSVSQTTGGSSKTADIMSLFTTNAAPAVAQTQPQWGGGIPMTSSASTVVPGVFNPFAGGGGGGGGGMIQGSQAVHNPFGNPNTFAAVVPPPYGGLMGGQSVAPTSGVTVNGNVSKTTATTTTSNAVGPNAFDAFSSF